MDRETVGLNVRLARMKQNLTQEQLAERAEMSASYLSAVERGKQSVSLEYVNRIAQALHIPVAELLVPEPAEENNGTDLWEIDCVEDSEGKYVPRQRKLNMLKEVLSKCDDREFEIIYDEVSLLIKKLRYFSDKGKK